MFCPKCGSQNADDTKFCRGCGADLSHVTAALQGKLRDDLPLAEKHIHLFSSGLRGLIIGVGLLVVAGVGVSISSRLGVLVLFALAFGFFFLGTGISRLVQGRAIKRLRSPKSSEPTPELSAGNAEYIKPSRSVYETDDLVTTPRSVTEHTTTHLKMDPEKFPEE